MKRDQGPKYSLGFGISPSNVPIQSDSEGNIHDAASPTAGVVARALHGHPVAKFLTVTAATLTAVHVADKVMHGGGVKLGEKLAAGELPFVQKAFQKTLSSHFRSLQTLLDDWEGVAHGDLDLKKASFWLTNAEKERMARRRETGGLVSDVAEWTLRDTIQQRLVSKARQLPYELPSAYAGAKVANRISGNQDRDPNEPPLHWYNPVDVVSDFARQSLHNVTHALLPWEVGKASLGHGWNRLMTLGDEVTQSGTFHPQIREFSKGLRGVLELFGQDSSDFIANTIKRSSQVTGSFGSAIREGMNSKRPGGFLYNKRLREAMEGVHDGGLFEGAKRLSPTARGVARGFKEHWDEFEKDSRNEEAIRAGRSHYHWKNNLYNVDRKRVRTGVTDIEQVADFVAGNAPDLEPGEWATGAFAQMKQRRAYRQLLHRHLSTATEAEPNVLNEEAAERVRNALTLWQMPSMSRDDVYDPAMQARSRLKFGNKEIFEGTDSKSWEHQLAAKMVASGDLSKDEASTFRRIVVGAVQKADAEFTNPKFKTKLQDDIKEEWRDLYERGILPNIKSRLGETHVSYSAFHEGMNRESQEALIRTVAEHIGVPLREEGRLRSASELTSALGDAGINVSDHYSLRAILVDKGVIAKPWQPSGFNVLGLRKLGVKKALESGFFSERQEGRIRSISEDLDRLDPHRSVLVDRGVGRGVFETRSGQIVDLSKVMHGVRRTKDLISQNLQIPVLRINPFTLVGDQARREMARKPLIQIQDAMGTQLPSVAKSLEGSDTLLFIRSKGGSKGRLYGHSLEGGVKDSGYDVRSANAMGEGLIPRNLRNVIGKKGYAVVKEDEEPTSNLGDYGSLEEWQRAQKTRRLSDDADEGWRSRLRDIFDVSDYQPDSIFDWAKRFGRGSIGKLIPGHTPDIRNPAEWAEQLLNIPEETRTGTEPYRYIPDLTQAEASAHRIAERHLRGFSFTDRTAKMFHDIAQNAPEDSPLRDLFSLTTFDTEGKEIQKPLHEFKHPYDLYRAVEKTFGDDIAHFENEAETTDVPSRVRDIRRAQGFTNKVYLDKETIPTFMDQPASQQLQARGIHRNIDAFKSDLYKYLFAKTGFEKGETGSVIRELVDSLDKLKAGNDITRDEYIQARAAILSMEANFLSLKSYSNIKSSVNQIREIQEGLINGPTRPLLRDVADYHPEAVGKRFQPLRKFMLRNATGMAKWQREGFSYNPFGAEQQNIYTPTLGSQLRRRPFRALKSLVGLSTWSDPEAFSTMGIATSHFHTRLNRYFSMFGLGVDEDKYKGPLGFLGKGLNLRRVAPAVAAATVGLTADRELGGLVHGKDQQGNRRYAPLVTGTLATGFAHAKVALTPGKERREKKREEYFGDREVAIRKGRYWPLGNQPFGGTRVQYFRPNWYKRMMSGYQYTDQTYDSPMEKLAYNYDFSPLRLVDPYHFEKKHYKDRPYPVTGEYFTGPWGAFTTAGNMTIGRILKPQTLMHQDEMDKAMGTFQRYGQYGMAQQQPQTEVPLVATRLPTGSSSILAPYRVGDLLGEPSPNIERVQPQGHFDFPYRQPYGFEGMPYGTSVDESLASYKRRNHLRRKTVGFHPGEADQLITTNGTASFDRPQQVENVQASPVQVRNRSRRHLRLIHGGIASSSGGGGKGIQPVGFAPGEADQLITTNGVKSFNRPYDKMLMVNPRNFDPRLMPAANSINPKSIKYQAGQVGYETQEMFGIYGFAAGQVKELMGFGPHDYTPNKPVLQSAARAYGSERSFWDLNLGGMGDFPVGTGGEFGNIEISEIARRFIPHRRRNTSELNPLKNTLGKQYPWLPGGDYFLNFHQGDPYTLIPEGEMRLPGPGYERTHELHPDATGEYGLLDKHAILGDIAPWSREYKAIDKAVRAMELTEEQETEAKLTRKQVAAVNKRQKFYRYNYAHSDFRQKQVKVVGFAPGEADQLITTDGLIRFAGVRARRTDESKSWMRNLIKPGDELSLTYDANYPARHDAPLDVIAMRGDQNLNKTIRDSEYGLQARTNNPIDRRQRESRIGFGLHALGERFSHLNTVFNTKFMPRRTAVEDWERTNVYGSNFPQWQHPFRDFVKPLGYRAMNRNPFIAAGVMAVVGRQFGRTDAARAALGLAGGALGFTLAFHSDAKTIQSGTRFIPKNRMKEAAIEENSDILNYVKYTRLYSQARQRAIAEQHVDPEDYARVMEEGEYKKNQFTNLGPDMSQALAYRKKIHQTMYGADPYGDVMDSSAAMPKRKRDHFLAFLNAPVNERERILSTAPRLERRIYEAKWGMKVEQRPDLPSYFQSHELPNEDWVGWSPHVETEDVKLKVAQNQGVDVSQMGYFPQQLQKANLINPTYPDFTMNSDHQTAAAKIRALMANKGINGHVIVRPSSTPGTNVYMNTGTYN